MASPRATAPGVGGARAVRCSGAVGHTVPGVGADAAGRTVSGPGAVAAGPAVSVPGADAAGAAASGQEAGAAGRAVSGPGADAAGAAASGQEAGAAGRVVSSPGADAANQVAPAPTSDAAERPASDQGSATVWSVGAVAVLCLVFGIVLGLGEAVVARHRAAGGADLAALAAADHWSRGGPAACAEAERVARAQRARLVRCVLTGQVSDVSAESGRGPFAAEVRARAGPALPAEHQPVGPPPAGPRSTEPVPQPPRPSPPPPRPPHPLPAAAP
ncbi:Rv3654c family TadE-like protein [Streptomyces parvulus]|uniref:Rv3654c family TadE-like protein n=1 Tax=Streptomyces parvulus TaxID=146923 RepID=UPI003F4BEBDA